MSASKRVADRAVGKRGRQTTGDEQRPREPRTMRYQVPGGTWSPERIVAAMRDWAKLVGQPPRIPDWCPSEHFEGPYLRHVWERHYPRWPEASTVKHHFGTWREGLIAAGLPVDRPPLELPLQDRITAARSLSAQGLRQVEIAAELGVHPSAVGNYLRAHLCDCGQRYVVVGRRCSPCANQRAAAGEWTKESVLAAIARWCELEGRPPTSEQWRPDRNPRERWRREYSTWPSAYDVRRQFGSWNKALRAAGITPVHPMGVTKDEVIAALKDAHAELGDTLSYKTYGAWASAHQRPSTSPMCKHFKTFTNACKAAGIA